MTIQNNVVGSATNSKKIVHSEFIQFYNRYGSSYTPSKVVNRSVIIKTDSSDKEAIKDIKREELRVLNRITILYPEALAYLFHLEGCPKRLFLYLLFLHTEKITGKIRFNVSVREEFIAFCKLFGTAYKDDTVKQAMKDLSEQNVVMSLKRGQYMINPMITGAGEKARTSALKEYSFLLAQGGKDTVEDFYPKY